MNVLEVLQELNIPYRMDGEHHHARSGWVQTDCGDCSPNSNRFRLGFNISYAYAACWNCGPKRLWEAISQLANQSTGQLSALLKKIERHPEQEVKHKGKLALPRPLGPLLPPHKHYLRERGFVPHQLARLWGIGGIGHLGGRLAWRLFIPITLRGEVVSWTTRTIASNYNEPPQRYINATVQQSAVPRSQLLYGMDYVKWAVVVVEGPTDVWAFGPGAVATLGIGYSQAQFNLLLKYPEIGRAHV